MIKPTVGRKVWYRPSSHDALGPIPMSFSHDQPLDATVIAVWGDRMVNVLVVDVYGRLFPKLSVMLLQDDEKPQTDNEGKVMRGYVEWMPYQQGQAKPAA